MRQQFFGSIGLTTTSANHIANMAKEEIQTIKNSIKNISYLKETAEAAGKVLETRKATSEDDFNNVEAKLLHIAQLTQLIAWLREAIKEKKSLAPLSFEAWYFENNGVNYPNGPVKAKALEEADVIATWDPNKYNAFLTAQTYAAVYGEAVHPDQPISKARKEYTDALTSPITVLDKGRDLTVYNLIPVFSQDAVEKQFFNLQKLQREWQAKYNSYLHEIEEAIQEDIDRCNLEYEKAFKEWNNQYKIDYAKWGTYYDKERNRINNLKIIVPDTLKAIFTEVSDLGK